MPRTNIPSHRSLFFGNGFSAGLHLFALGFLSLAAPTALWQHRVRTGRPLVLTVNSASVTSQAAFSVAVTIAEPTEAEPQTPELAEVAREPMDEPTIEVDATVPTSPELVHDAGELMAKRTEIHESLAIPPALERLPKRPSPPPQIAMASLASIPTPAPEPDEPVGAEYDQPPVKLPTNLPPAYPADALRSGIEGRVILMVKIDAEGGVRRALIDTTSGFAVLDQAAVEAVIKWRFSPALLTGRPVTAEVRIPIRFSIL